MNKKKWHPGNRHYYNVLFLSDLNDDVHLLRHICRCKSNYSVEIFDAFTNFDLITSRKCHANTIWLSPEIFTFISDFKKKRRLKCDLKYAQHQHKCHLNERIQNSEFLILSFIRFSLPFFFFRLQKSLFNSVRNGARIYHSCVVSMWFYYETISQYINVSFATATENRITHHFFFFFVPRIS